MPENESAFLYQMPRILDRLFLQKASRIAESSSVPEMEAFFFFLLNIGCYLQLEAKQEQQQQTKP